MYRRSYHLLQLQRNRTPSRRGRVEIVENEVNALQRISRLVPGVSFLVEGTVGCHDGGGDSGRELRRAVAHVGVAKRGGTSCRRTRQPPTFRLPRSDQSCVTLHTRRVAVPVVSRGLILRQFFVRSCAPLRFVVKILPHVFARRPSCNASL